MASDTKLTVSLILNDSSFTKQLAAVNKELKLSQSEFKNASAGTSNFENSLIGAQTKLKSLTSQLETQNNKISLYKTEIAKTEQTLTELTKTYKEQGTTLTSLRQKYEEVCKTLGETSPEAKELEKEIKALEKSQSNLENKILSTNTRLTTLKTGLNDAEAEFKQLSSQVTETNKTIEKFSVDKISASITKASEGLKNASEGLKNVSKGFDEASKTINKIAIPIVGVGVAATGVSISFEESMSKVKALSGTVGEDFETLERKAREMGASTSKSATQAADAMGYMALAGWDTQQMLVGIEPILRLSEAGMMDLATCSDLVTDSMGGLNLTTNDLTGYLDKVSQTSRISNTSVQQLMEAFLNCGATTKNLGIELSESSAALGVLANNGEKGFEAGTKLNSILTRMTAQSTIASGAWDRIGVSVFDAEGNFRGLTTVLSEVKGKLSDLSQEEQQYFLKQVAGTDNITSFMNLVNSTGGAIQNLTKEITNSDGALYEMAKTMQDNVKGQLTKLKSQLEELGLKLGETLLPMLSKLVSKASSAVNWFSNLSPGVQEAIVKFGVMTVSLAAVTKGITGLLNVASGFTGIASKVINSFSGISYAIKGVAAPAGTSMGAISKLIGAIGGLNPVTIGVTAAVAGLTGAVYLNKKSQDVMSKSILVTTDEMSWLEKKLDKLNGGYSKSRAELEKLGVVQKELSDTLSDDFKRAIEESEEALNDFSIFLNETSFDEILSEEEANQLASRVDNMCQSAINAIKSRQEETNKAMQEMFASDGVLTESEQKVLEYLERSSNANIEEATNLKNEIYAIKQQALNDQRDLNEEEIKAIEDKTRRIKELELQALGTSHEERMYAEKDFAYRVQTMTLEEAEKLLQEKAKLRDEEIINIRAGYDTYIDILKEKLQDAEGEEKLHYENAIKDAEQARDDKIKVQNDLYDEYLKIINEKNPEVAALIDKYNGDALTKEELQKQDVLKKLNERYEDMNLITEDGLYKMKMKNSDQWNDVVVTVDEATGEIIGAVELHSSEVGAYNDETCKSLEDLRNKYKSELSESINKVNEMANATVDSKGRIVGANGEIVGSLKDVKKNSDGTREGIISLNGTEMKIKTNAQGVITNLKEIKEKILDIPSSKTVDVKVKYQEVGKALTSGLNAGISAATGGRRIEAVSPYSIAQESTMKLARSISNIEVPTPIAVNTVSNAVEVPNPTSYINKTVSSIAKVKSVKSQSSNDMSEIMYQTLQESQKQNNLLLTLISLMQENKSLDIQLAVDGKQIAKTTAKYMQTELQNLSLRKTRLGGAY